MLMSAAVAILDPGSFNVYGLNVSLVCAAIFGTAPYAFSWTAPSGSTSLSRVSYTDSPGSDSASGSSIATFIALYGDTGEYTCTAMDSMGDTDSDTASLEIG